MGISFPPIFAGTEHYLEPIPGILVGVQPDSECKTFAQAIFHSNAYGSLFQTEKV